MHPSSVVIHVPHASTLIPDAERGSFRANLKDELLKMTDMYCGELFCGEYKSVVFPVSRLVCDPERFRSDADEPMSRVGMGAVYTRTHSGETLREVGEAGRERILRAYYDPHHAGFTAAVQAALDRTGGCLIIDGHSFCPRPLPYEQDQNPVRPDFCIGSDPFHTPKRLEEAAVVFLRERGFTAAVNAPFAGAIVPMRFYRRDARVRSVMIEVNRRLYMRGDGSKNSAFEETRRTVRELMRFIIGECRP